MRFIFYIYIIYILPSPSGGHRGSVTSRRLVNFSSRRSPYLLKKFFSATQHDMPTFCKNSKKIFLFPLYSGDASLTTHWLPLRRYTFAGKLDDNRLVLSLSDTGTTGIPHSLCITMIQYTLMLWLDRQIRISLGILIAYMDTCIR